MRKESLFFLLCFASFTGFAQTKTSLIGDSVIVRGNTGPGELILQNSTQGVPGFLYNKGGGRTEFRRGLLKLNDNSYLIGGDTLNISQPNPNGFIQNQYGSDQSANFRITGNGSAQNFYSSLMETNLVQAYGGLRAGYYANQFSLQVDANSPLASVVITPNTFGHRPALYIGPGGYEPALTVGTSWAYPTDHTIGVFYNNSLNAGLQGKNSSAYKMYWDVRNQNEQWPESNIYKGYSTEMHTGNTKTIGYYANITGNSGNNYALFADSGKVFIREGVTVGSLAGSGNRMVIADANGNLNTQTISTGGVTGTAPAGNNGHYQFNNNGAFSGGNIYYSNGNVGIGTVSPNTLVQVRESGSSIGSWRGRIAAGGDNNAVVMGEAYNHAWLGGHNSNLSSWSDLYINPNGNVKTFIGGVGIDDNITPIITTDNFNGKVGIGTTNPIAKLHVVGEGTMAYFSSSSSPVQSNIYSIAIDKSYINSLLLGVNKNSITGSVPADMPFISTYSGGLSLGRGGGNGLPSYADLVIDNDGKIGVGTTTPQAPLNIVHSPYNTPGLLVQTGGGGSQAGIVLRDLNDGNRSINIGHEYGGLVMEGANAGINGFIVRGGCSNLHLETNACSNSYITMRPAGVEAMRVLPGGNIGIGTTSPTHTLSVNGEADKVGGGSWLTYSDARMKKNIEPFTDGLDKVLQINPKLFQYNGKGFYKEDGKQYIGILAQEIQKVAPYMVSAVKGKLDEKDAGETDILQYDGNALPYLLVNAVKEQQKQIEVQQKQINQLAAQNQQLIERLEKLEKKLQP